MKKIFVTLLLALFVFVSSPNFADAKNTIRKHRRYHARTYTNVDGHRVQSPVRASSAPAGASAECRDGSYSFSEHRRGTCSHHGGVKRWL